MKIKSVRLQRQQYAGEVSLDPAEIVAKSIRHVRASAGDVAVGRIEAWAIGVTPDHVEIYRIEPGIHKMGDLATDAGLEFRSLAAEICETVVGIETVVRTREIASVT